MGRRRALIVANSEYDHPGLSRLRSPAADAVALAEVLGDRRISDFEVEVVHNETTGTVQEHVDDFFAEGRPDDVLLLHFSCHGLKSESGELFFAARNTKPERIASTAVPATFVQGCMVRSRSRSIVLLLDCCFSGAFSNGVAVRTAGDVHVRDSLPAGRGRAVITATNSMEYAFEGARLAGRHEAGPSVFTSALVNGLSTGEADRDADGLISLSELYDYVFDRVRQHNPNQTPSRDIAMQGELYLARSTRMMSADTPMPLAEAVRHPNRFTRLGAVGELRKRLASEDLSIALEAFKMLRGIADRDIREVAMAAREALSDVAIRPSTRELRFVSHDPLVVRLGGPPLARACTAMPSRDWIQVLETDSGFSVTVSPLRMVAAGRVKFQGPTGEAFVDVTASIPPPAAEPMVQAPPAAPEPAAEETPSSRVEDDRPALQWGGFVLGTTVALLTLFGGYYHGDRLWVARSAMVWYFAPLAFAAVVAGVCLLVPRARPVGLGVLIAAASLTPFGISFLIADAGTHDVGDFGGAFWSHLVWLVLLVVAAVMAARHVSGLRWASARSKVHAVCGIGMSVFFLLLVVAVARSSLSEGPLEIVPALSMMLAAPIAPLLAARALPQALAVAVAVTWTLLVIAVVVAYTMHGSIFHPNAIWLWVPLLPVVLFTLAPRPKL